MSLVSGTYVTVFDSNPRETFRAVTLEPLTDEEMALALSPENKMTMTYNEFEDESGVCVSINSTLVKKVNGEWKYKYNTDTKMEEIKGSFISIKNGNEITEVVKLEDSSVITYKMVFSSMGVKMNVSTSALGHVSTLFCKRQDPPMTGFYVMDKAENAEKAFEGTGISDAAMKKMMSHVSCRIVDQGDGLVSLTDYFGNGSAKTITFKYGEEFDYEDKELGMKGVHLVTKTGPGQITYVAKDTVKGTTEVWEGCYQHNGMVWTTEKNGNKIKFCYKRYPDFAGKWKRIVCSGMEQLMTTVGIPKDLAQRLATDDNSMTITYMGADLWSLVDHNKVVPTPEIIFKMGEEVTVAVEQLGTFKMTICFTHDGCTWVKKSPNGTIIKATAKVGETFFTCEEEVVGGTGTKATIIFVKE